MKAACKYCGKVRELNVDRACRECDRELERNRLRIRAEVEARRKKK